MKKRKFLLLTVVVLSIFLVYSTVFATPSANILYYETDLGGGSWQYDYRFENTSDASEYLYSVYLFFDTTYTITGSPLPTGWEGIVWEGTNSTDWLDTYTTDSSYDIAAGNTFSGFRFTIDYQAGSIPYSAYFDDHSGGFFETSGMTAPEPISSLLFLFGGATLAVRRYLRRRRE